MLSTVNGLLIFLVALIPGVPGERVYSWIVGLDWREEQFRRVVRVILFSISGLILYVLVAHWRGWWMPRYLLPQLYGQIDETIIFQSAITYLGHGIGALIVGSVSAGVRHWAATPLGQTVSPTAWHDLVNNRTDDHWVVVKLKNGQSFAGILESADWSVPPAERDVLLKEPALYNEEREDYITQAYQYLFLPAARISSVAVLYKEELDKADRITKIDRGLYTDTGYE